MDPLRLYVRGDGMRDLGEYKPKQPSRRREPEQQRSIGGLPEPYDRYSALIVTTVTAVLWSPQEELRSVIY